MAFQDVATSLGLSPEAVEAIPKELREDKTLEPIKDLTGLITSHRDVQKMIGGRIAIPKEDDEKGWNDLYGKLGRPESPDKYEVKLPKPDVINWNQDFVKSIQVVAHKAGVNGKQLQAIINGYADLMIQGNIENKKAFDDAVNTLKSEWGGAFDRNTALTKRLVMQYGGDELKDFFKDDPSGNDPRVIRFLARIANELDEGGYLEGGETGVILDVEGAKSQIAAVMANPEDLYHAKFAGKPGHKERVEEVSKLYDIAYGKI